MACPDVNQFLKHIRKFDQAVEIEKDKDKPLRYDVWRVRSSHVNAMMENLNTEQIPNPKESLRVLKKIENALKRVKNNENFHTDFHADIFKGDYSIEKSIAMQEVMEAVKGEADKARNMGIPVAKVSNSQILPNLPLSRVAASIGRKIAFQKGYRFARATKADTSADIELLYYEIGERAIYALEQKGYIKRHKKSPTLKDYLEKKDLKKDFPKIDPITENFLSISLVEKKFGIKKGSSGADYFLNRTLANIEDTHLASAVDMLKAASQITQPQTVVLPERGDWGLMHKKTLEEKYAEQAQWDDGIKKPDPAIEKARRETLEKPLSVNKSIHGLMEALHTEINRTGKSASEIINSVFKGKTKMVLSLFGMKESDNYSIDKKESISGQNLSKTTPVDDIAEYYDQLIRTDGSPAPLHLPMKIGRNGRLYYLNSVLNPHASKQSRYMLTPGEYTVDSKGDDFDYLVYGISKALNTKKKSYTYKDITQSGSELDAALTEYDNYMNADGALNKLKALGPLARRFEGVDYVQILTGLQAVRDVRNPVKGQVKTEFTVSSDATASGGTITFMQALGTNDLVTEFLQRIGLLEGGSLKKGKLDDLYGLMSEAIQNFKEGKIEGVGPDIGAENVVDLLKSTLDMLFNEGKDIREFSKDPTMTFVYNQGRDGAIDTLSRSLADRVIDNLDKETTRKYLANLLDDDTYLSIDSQDLKEVRGLYDKIVKALKKKGLPAQLYDLMKDTIKDKYLLQYAERSDAVFEFLKQLPDDSMFKVLTAGAVLSGKTAAKDLAKFGMPLTKIFELSNKVTGYPDNVLTRREKLTKSIQDVSTTHGFDAAQLFHSIASAGTKNGLVTVHDDIRGNVQDVRKIENQFMETTVQLVEQYDVHQQVMEAIAAQNPEIAASAEFKALKAKIDEDVKKKRDIIANDFNKDTTALIGDGSKYRDFAKGSNDTSTEAAVEPKKPAPEPETEPETSTEQDFGSQTIEIKGVDATHEVLAQEAWDDIQSRLEMVKRLRECRA